MLFRFSSHLRKIQTQTALLKRKQNLKKLALDLALIFWNDLSKWLLFHHTNAYSIDYYYCENQTKQKKGNRNRSKRAITSSVQIAATSRPRARALPTTFFRFIAHLIKPLLEACVSGLAAAPRQTRPQCATLCNYYLGYVLLLIITILFFAFFALPFLGFSFSWNNYTTLRASGRWLLIARAARWILLCCALLER